MKKVILIAVLVLVSLGCMSSGCLSCSGSYSQDVLSETGDVFEPTPDDMQTICGDHCIYEAPEGFERETNDSNIEVPVSLTVINKPVAIGGAGGPQVAFIHKPSQMYLGDRPMDGGIEVEKWGIIIQGLELELGC